MKVAGQVHALRGKRAVAAMVATLGLLGTGTGLMLATPGTAGANSTAVQVTPGIASKPTVHVGEVFFQTTFTLAYVKGKVRLAGTAAGSGTTLVEDGIIVRVRRPDGTTVLFSHNYEKNACGVALASHPMDLTGMFKPGANTVTVQLQDLCGDTESSTALFVR
jgi:hypothetical protein